MQSKGLSDKTIKPCATSDNILTPLIDYCGSKVRLTFNGSYLKQSDKLPYNYRSWVNIYIVFELGASGSNDSNPTLKNCLFGAFTLTKTQILKNMGILVMELDLIEDQASHFLVVDLVEMYLLLEQT